MFEKYIDYIIKNNEGGYVDDKYDSGGATKYGISNRFLKVNKIDINNDGVVNKKDIKDLTKGDAKHIYKKHFWNPLYEELKDQYVAYRIFDSSILMGKVKIIKIVQYTLRFHNIKDKINQTIEADGIFGQNTLYASNNDKDLKPVLDLKIKQELTKISLKNNNKRFLKGWINRVERCPHWLMKY